MIDSNIKSGPTFMLTMTEQSANLLGYKTGLIVGKVKILREIKNYMLNNNGIGQSRTKIVELECELV